jgi:hypothetical protein
VGPQEIHRIIIVQMDAFDAIVSDVAALHEEAERLRQNHSNVVIINQGAGMAYNNPFLAEDKNEAKAKQDKVNELLKIKNQLSKPAKAANANVAAPPAGFAPSAPAGFGSPTPSVTPFPLPAAKGPTPAAPTFSFAKPQPSANTAAPSTPGNAFASAAEVPAPNWSNNNNNNKPATASPTNTGFFNSNKPATAGAATQAGFFGNNKKK